MHIEAPDPHGRARWTRRLLARGAALLAASEAPHYDTSEREVQYWSIIMHYARGPKGAVCVLAAGLLIGLVAPTVRAADAPPDKPFEEPGITYMQRSDAYIQWIAGSLFIAACLLIAFKNPHRSHLD